MRRVPLLLGLLFALAACGGGGDDGAGRDERSPAKAVAAAATKTADAGSSRMSFTAVIDPPKAVSQKPFQFGGTGVFDYESRRGRLNYDLAGLLAAAGQETTNAKAEVVFDELVVYMKFPLLTQSLPNAKPWIKIDLAALGDQAGIDLGQLAQLNQADPSNFLRYLRAVSKGVNEVGEDDVRGVATTHYRARVDLDKVVEQAPADERDQVRASIGTLLEATGAKTFPGDVWIDGDGLVRRQSTKVTMKTPAGASGEEQEATMTMTMELFDFGVEVDAEPPPASQVTDLATLLPGAN